MSDPDPRDGGTQDGGVIRVDTDQVAGVVPLEDLLTRVRDGAAARAAQARAAAPGAPADQPADQPTDQPADHPADPEALDRISALAAQLADELARLGPLD